MLFLELILLLIPLLLVLVALSLMLIFLFGPPFVPTPMHIIHQLIQIADINEKDTVIDLGSGDGRMLIASAQKGAQAKGWEINPFLVLWTKLYALRYGVGDKVDIYLKSYHTADLSNATVVFLYNLPKYMPQLEKKMKAQLKPGTKILTYKFLLPTIKPTNQPKPDIYLYKV